MREELAAEHITNDMFAALTRPSVLNLLRTSEGSE